MTGAEATNVPFQRPKDFDLEEHLRGSFGVYQGQGDEQIGVRVRFSPTVARYVEESTWHASQQLTRQRDGSVLAEFVLSSTEEIQRWILSFGRHAEVLEPASLRAAMATELGSMLAAYAGPAEEASVKRRRRLRRTQRR